MVFTTQRDGASMVATWEPGHRRFALIVDGRVAIKARHLRTDKAAQLAWSRRESSDLGACVRTLAEDIGGMLNMIAGAAGFDLGLDEAGLPDLGGWRCSTCAAPMITPRTPNTVQTLECPLCMGRRATAERCSVALAIMLVEARIAAAIAKEPMRTSQTQAEVEEATAELRRLIRHLSGGAGGPANTDGDGSQP